MIETAPITFHPADGTTIDGELVTEVTLPTQFWTITPAPDGNGYSGYPTGVLPPNPNPLPPQIATIPAVAPGSTPVTVNMTTYVSGTYASLTMQNLPSGWTFNGTTLTGTGPAAAGSGLTLTALSANAPVVSNTFSVPAVAASLGGDTYAPTIATAIRVALNASFQPVITVNAANDPSDPTQTRTGMKETIFVKAGSDLATVASPSTGLAAPCVAQTIGSPAVAGTLSQAGASFTYTAGGLDFSGTADQGFYPGGQVTGDFSITYKLTTATWPQQFAKVGIGARSTTDPGSPCVQIVACRAADGGFIFGGRLTQGASNSDITAVLTGTAYALPVWLKLTRAGNVWSSYYSTDSLTFNPVGNVTLALPATVIWGIPGSAHAATGSVSAQIDQFCLTQDADIVYTDTTTSQTGSPQTIAYGVAFEDLATNRSGPSPTVSVTIPATSVVTPGWAAGSGATKGQFVDPSTGIAFIPMGIGILGLETVEGNGGAGYLEANGYARDNAIGQATSAALTAAMANAYNSLSAAAKPFAVFTHFRININTAKVMAFTGRDPHGTYNTSTNGNLEYYYSAGTDSAGNKLYCGGPGGGPGSGIGQEQSGDPTRHRTALNNLINACLGATNPLGKPMNVLLNLMWGTPTLSSNGQYVLPSGQSAMPHPGDLLALEYLVGLYGTQNGTTGTNRVAFELLNEPFGTLTLFSNWIGNEAAYLGSQQLTQFDFPTAATSPAGTGGGYQFLNNGIGTGPILGGNVTVKAIGQQQMINAVRAMGAGNMIAVNCMGFSGEIETWAAAGGKMVVSDPNNNICASHHSYGGPNESSSTHISQTFAANAAAIKASGVPFLCTEMGSLSGSYSDGSSYTAYKNAGYGYTFWGWPAYGYTSGFNALIKTNYPWATGNGQVAPTGSN